MPRLLLAAVCESCIQDKDDNRLSLVNLLETITLSIPAGESIPEDARAAQAWALVTFWLQEPDDKNKTFEQRARILQPDGKIITQFEMSFEVDKRGHRLIARGLGFPITQQGEILFKVWLRQANSDQDWVEVAEYPVQLIHQSAQPPAAPIPE